MGPDAESHQATTVDDVVEHCYGFMARLPWEASPADGVVNNVESGVAGVFLKWQDLSVTAINGRKSRAVILDGLSGYARPGEVLALMGPSGCGKTTLLDTLAGRLRPNMKGTGDILINGCRQKVASATSAYVTQENVLMATLTVAEAVHYSAQLQLPDSLTPAEKRSWADDVIRQMGLATVAGTRIGGRVCKGISGGQRKRVSICIELLASPALIFLDEPTSGLDSAASYHVMSRIAGIARRNGTTVVAAIHQPSTEVFELFHGLCLLANGRAVYFGPASKAIEFSVVKAYLENIGPGISVSFTYAVSGLPKNWLLNREEPQGIGRAKNQTPSNQMPSLLSTPKNLAKRNRFFDANGFPCPLRRNPSDHFLRMINTDFEEAQEESAINLAHAAKVIQTLVASFGSLAILGTEMEASKTIKQESDHVLQRRQATFWTKSIVLTKRSMVNMHRDIGYYWLRFVINIALFLTIGTIFFNVGDNYASIQARASMLMFTSTFMTMMAIGGFPSFVEDMKIFEKEQRSGHYGAIEFVIANTLSSTLYLGLISILPAAIAYYLTGLQRGIEHFFFFVATLWTCTMLVEGLMMIVAAIVPDFLLGIIMGSGVQGLLMLNAGFFRLPNDLPKPIWKYPTYYISYQKYTTQGLYKNEFLGLVFQDFGVVGGIDISGQYILKNNLQVELGYSKWVDLAILLGMVIIYRVLFLVIIKVSKMAKPFIKCLIAKV
ncbi:ABC transporter G family member 15 [Triticum urartu]|uniref:ABC transporter G family member 15 n=1 Tax=Triticum urartu TaxID=4572 RepID=M7ZGH1_TRIUA|nr:ABC transporter G family member 15 [Triticum urartu]